MTAASWASSLHPWEGYDYDTFAADLKAVLDGLDLHEVISLALSAATSSRRGDNFLFVDYATALRR